jgi:uncharacterized protein
MRKLMRLNFSVVIPLIIVNIVVFFLQSVLGEGFTNTFALSQFDLFRAPWTLLTSMFMHANAMHLFFNMYVLLIFGPLLESKIGPLKFSAGYFATGLFAAIITQFFYPQALGASGAIMGIMGMIMILIPNLQVLFFFFIPMPLWVAGIMIALIDLLGVFGVGILGVANLAHLAGLALGLIIGRLFKQATGRFYRKFEKNTQMDEEDIEEYLRSGRI